MGETLQGDTVTASLDPVRINEANVVQADVLATNGVIHAIDSVLLPPAKPTQSIVELAVENDDLNTLVQALTAADLVDTLSGDGPFTVFAPTNAAFAALPEGTLESLLLPENKDQLTDILLYHVLASQVLSTDLTDGLKAETLQGDTVTASLDPVRINDANVLTPDVLATNGVVHVIDAVLLPPAKPTQSIVELAVENDDLNTLVQALTAADLVDTLNGDGPFTVFAPTDAAFAALPEGTLESLLLSENKDQLTDILLYHVASGKVLSTDLTTGQKIPTLEGGTLDVSIAASKSAFSSLRAFADIPDIGTTATVMINGATVVTADVEATNGVVHIIDAVLLPEAEDDDRNNGAAQGSTVGLAMAVTTTLAVAALL